MLKHPLFQGMMVAAVGCFIALMTEACGPPVSPTEVDADVKDQDTGLPVPNATVTCTDQTGQTCSGTTDALGMCTCSGSIQPGPIVVQTSCVGYGPSAMTAVIGQGQTLNFPISLTPNAPEFVFQITFPLQIYQNEPIPSPPNLVVVAPNGSTVFSGVCYPDPRGTSDYLVTVPNLQFGATYGYTVSASGYMNSSGTVTAPTTSSSSLVKDVPVQMNPLPPVAVVVLTSRLGSTGAPTAESATLSVGLSNLVTQGSGSFASGTVPCAPSTTYTYTGSFNQTGNPISGSFTTGTSSSQILSIVDSGGASGPTFVPNKQLP